MQIEHELRDRAFETGESFLQDHEARARHARGGFEIHLAELLAEIEMLLRLEVDARLGTDTANFAIGLLVRAVGNFGRREVRDRREDFVDRGLELALFLLAPLDLVLEACDFGHQRLACASSFLALA